MPQKQAGIRLVENLMAVSWGIQLTETGIRSGTFQFCNAVKLLVEEKIPAKRQG